jgi:hypothetical protein
LKTPVRLLALILLVAGAAMGVAAVRTSTTFDEIVLVSSGARILAHGGAPLASDQPPLASYLYALPLRAAAQILPSEVGRDWDYTSRWEYARDLYFRVGNDPATVALLSRAVAIAMALALIVVTFAYGTWMVGPAVGLLAAALTALLPDVLAHGAVAYNDVPLALTYLAGIWAADVFVRRPSLRSGTVVGVLAAAALGIKFSAIALVPAAVVLLALEAPGRRAEFARWTRSVAFGGLAAVVAAYVVTVLIYRGDFWLLYLEAGFRSTIRHAAAGHPAPAYLLGETSEHGFWYFFPMAFLFKTPAALHLLLPVALWGIVARSSGRGSGAIASGEPGGRVATLLSSRLRGPAVGFLIFGAFLLRTGLNVGFRYAIPALPPFILLVAAGVFRTWTLAGARQRVAVALLLLLYAGSTLSVAPHFLGYRSEWARMRPPGKEALIDSSVDWGQGLIALGDYMRKEGLDRVRLSYFGSALPEAYGVAYDPLPSFLPLAPPNDGASGVTVISVTNLHGLYFEGADPFASYRERSPDRILAGSLYVYSEE